MAKQITQYELLISCPGDIIDEVKIIEDVVEKFNQQFSATLGISILTRHWSKSSYPNVIKLNVKMRRKQVEKIKHNEIWVD